MRLTINGEDRTIENAGNVAELLGELGIAQTKVAVERNLEIVPKSGYGQIGLEDGDRLEIVHFIGGGAPEGGDTEGHPTHRSVVGIDRIELPRLGISFAATAEDPAASRDAGYIDPSGLCLNTVDPQTPVRRIFI